MSTKLSAITASGANMVSGDTLVGVHGGNTDLLFSGAQITAGVLAIQGSTGSGSFVLATSPTLTTPVLGVATATSLAIGGATIGSNALAVTGLVNFGSAGSVSAPTLSVGNATTGFSSVSTTGLAISVNGVNKLDFGITNGGRWSLNDVGVRHYTSGNLDLDLFGYRSGLNFASAFGISWDNSNPISGVVDTGVSRSAAGVIAFGNGTAGDGSATILAKTKAGAPTTGDVPSSTWALIRDTTNSTTKVYYNNAGTLQSVALA